MSFLLCQRSQCSDKQKPLPFSQNNNKIAAFVSICLCAMSILYINIQCNIGLNELPIYLVRVTRFVLCLMYTSSQNWRPTHKATDIVFVPEALLDLFFFLDDSCCLPSPIRFEICLAPLDSIALQDTKYWQKGKTYERITGEVASC